ncbi:hypothetical protein AVEN_82512-1 [Araneus ventricosus]|uniref:Uncharacterized protein n=1 Tax=Araneus ventricosus TaxID=182803 RepID=A0A4Y2SFJ7_ARAVE|nr:hypothetical protein AVEN_82512-1 [Araneus ventricosus]
MSIRKAEGQYLNVVGLVLLKSCFSHGQLYVGCSRIGKAYSLHILAPNGRTANIVCPEALSRNISSKKRFIYLFTTLPSPSYPRECKAFHRPEGKHKTEEMNYIITEFTKNPKGLAEQFKNNHLQQ